MQNLVIKPALALDTTGNQCQMALALPDGSVTEHSIEQMHGHASFLLPEMNSFLHRHGLPLSGLQTLIVVTGPGGFTGLRMGLAFARVLARLTPIHVLGVDAFTLQALQPYATFPSTLLLDTRRGDSFAQDYDETGQKRGAPYTKPVLAPNQAYSLAPLFTRNDYISLNPLYVRDADTSVSKQQKPYTIEL